MANGGAHIHFSFQDHKEMQRWDDLRAEIHFATTPSPHERNNSSRWEKVYAGKLQGFMALAVARTKSQPRVVDHPGSTLSLVRIPKQGLKHECARRLAVGMWATREFSAGGEWDGEISPSACCVSALSLRMRERRSTDRISPVRPCGNVMYISGQHLLTTYYGIDSAINSSGRFLDADQGDIWTQRGRAGNRLY